MQANPSFKRGATPTPTDEFIARIENADPTAPDISEDDHGSSWGHLQFTGGSMTVTSVLTTWGCVGNTETACRLIAAAIKTCKVARHICFEQNVTTSSYLSDAYLQNSIEVLWKLWNDAGGVCISASYKFSLYLAHSSLLVFHHVQSHRRRHLPHCRLHLHSQALRHPQPSPWCRLSRLQLSRLQLSCLRPSQLQACKRTQPPPRWNPVSTIPQQARRTVSAAYPLRVMQWVSKRRRKNCK